MLQQVYVIDLIVRDLDPAVEYFTKILRVKPMDTTGIGGNVGEFRMAHFPTPGGGAGLHSIGLFQLTTDFPRTAAGIRAKQTLDRHGEGPFLIGFLVDDIEATQRDMESEGLQFVDRTPESYQMGRGNALVEKFGTTIWFAQHDPDGYQKYLKLRRRD